MGPRRTASERRQAARAALAADDRQDMPTLLQCPACEGHGRIAAPDVPGTPRFHVRSCGWCGGAGMLEAAMLPLFTRWLRLRNRCRLHARS